MLGDVLTHETRERMLSDYRGQLLYLACKSQYKDFNLPTYTEYAQSLRGESRREEASDGAVDEFWVWLRGGEEG